MARVDDFLQSFELAAKSLAAKDLQKVAEASGAGLEDGALCLEYYGRPLRVRFSPPGVEPADAGPELPPAEQALVLHYLDRALGREPSGQWITYRQTREGSFYWASFVKRAINPLTEFFGERPALLKELAPRVGGAPAEGVADAEVVIRAFPRVSFLFQLWEGDEEFPAKGNVLMDEHIEDYLSAEDIALAAGLPVYKMMALAREGK